MAERSSLNQLIQVGVEATPGTPATITKRFQSIGLEPSPKVEVDQYRPAGSKYRQFTALSKEWVEAAISGRGSYTEIVYLLSSVIDTPVITTPGGATTARLWTFTPDTYADDVPKTFTVEHGSSVRADSFAYGLVTELGMKFDRNTVDVSGSMMGRALTDGITMTSGGVTSVPLVPIEATQVSVYVDDTAAGLGTTKLTRALNAEFTLGSRFGPVWVLDAAQDSFVNHIETEPDLHMTLTVEANSEGMGFLTSMRDSDTAFIRVEAIGSEIETGENYTFTLDLAGRVRDTGGFSDADGVYAIQWDFVGVHDPTWNKAVQFNVENALAAL